MDSGYETEVISHLTLKSKVDLEFQKYDFTRWKINDERIEWIGGKNDQDIEPHLQKLIEDVFGISGSVEWQGEDDEDYGTLTIKNNKVTTIFGKQI